MIYIYGHAPSDHREEFKNKAAALRYLREWLPKDNAFRYRTTFNKNVDIIIFSFGGELLAELVVDQIIPPTKEDAALYAKVKKTYLIQEIRIFKNKTFRTKDFPLKHSRFGTKVPPAVYDQIIEAVDGFETTIPKFEQIKTPTIAYSHLTVFYTKFIEFVEAQSPKTQFRSFLQHPFVYDEEGYKYDIHRVGRKNLNLMSWQETDIGSGRIIEQTIAAIEFPQNNLLQHTLKRGEDSRYHQSLYNAQGSETETLHYEKLLYDFYFDQISTDLAFERFIKFAKKKYAYLAYLFFLKDWGQYMPIAPDTFDKAFALLEVDFVTSRQCSWENYQTYNGLIQQVRDFLREQIGPDVTLLDAHSFLWIIGRKFSPDTTSSFPPTIATYETYIPHAIGSPPRSDSPVNNKPNYIEQQRRQTAIGQLAQQIVLTSEKNRLQERGRADLADQVEDVSDQTHLGYDILSYDETGQEMQIEVKAVKSMTGRKTFFLTQNELEKSQQLPNYHLYLVKDVKSDSPKILDIPQPAFDDETQFNLKIVNYRVWIG